MTTWTGRQPKGMKDTNSFKTFISRARKSKAGQDHMRRHHRGYNPKVKEEDSGQDSNVAS